MVEKKHRLEVVTLATRHSVGGAQLNASLIADEFNRLGMCSEAWFFMNAGDMPATTSKRHIFLDGVTKNPFSVFVMFIRFLSRLRERKPEVIVGFHPLANILGAIGAAICGAKFVGTQRNPSSSQSVLLKILELLIGSTNLYASNITVSHAVADSYRMYPKSYKRKIRVIHNGLGEASIERRSTCSLRTKFSLPDKEFIVGFLGRLDFQKNPEFLLEVLSRTSEAHLAVAGDGPLKDALVARADALGISGRIHFVGMLSRNDIYDFLRSLDIFLMCSHYEGFGRTLIEAMQVGIPVIANDLPVTREVLSTAGTFLPLEPLRWAKKIEMFAEDPIRLEALGSLSKNRSEYFSITRMVSSYEGLVKECKAGSPAAGVGAK